MYVFINVYYSKELLEGYGKKLWGAPPFEFGESAEEKTVGLLTRRITNRAATYLTTTLRQQESITMMRQFLFLVLFVAVVVSGEGDAYDKYFKDKEMDGEALQITVRDGEIHVDLSCQPISYLPTMSFF